MISYVIGLVISGSVAAAAPVEQAQPSAATPPAPVPEPPAPAVQSPVPAPPPAPVAGASLVLPMGTEVPMKTLRELSSKRSRQGDRFDLVVSEDVVLDGHVVIPLGSRGIGEVTRLEPKGAFGKSGKLETRLLYVSVGNSRIRLDGSAADRGKSGTGATVATAVFVGIASAFVTGTSAVIPEGSTMIGYVDRDIPILLQRTATPPPAPIVVPATPALTAAASGGTSRKRKFRRS